MDLNSPHLKKLLITLAVILVAVLIVTVYLINKDMGKKDELQEATPSPKEKPAVDLEIIKSLTAPAPAETPDGQDAGETVNPEIIKSLTAPTSKAPGNPTKPVDLETIKSLTTPK